MKGGGGLRGAPSGYSFNPSAGDYAPALPSVGVRAPTRLPPLVRRGFRGFHHRYCVLSSLPLGFVALRFCLSALPRVLLVFLRPGTCASRNSDCALVAWGPISPGSWAGGAPIPRPPSPGSLRSPRAVARLRGERCPLRSLLFFRLRVPVVAWTCCRTSSTNIGPAYSYHSTFA